MHRRSWFRPWVSLLVVVSILFAVGAAAEEDEDREKSKKTNYTVSRRVAKQLTPALEALKDEHYAESEKRLKKLEKRANRLTPYERALIYQMLGYLDSGRGQMPEALAYFEKCLLEDSLPPSQQNQTRFNVAQLYLSIEEFSEAVTTLERWFEDTENPNSNAYYMLAVARYQNDNIQGAIEPAETAIQVAEQVREPWLQLLVGLYYETNEHEKARQPLEALIMLNPRRTYWTQLSSLYAHLGMEPRSLAVMQLAYQQGYLETDRELRQLSQLYLYHDAPYWAAKVIQQGLDDEIIVADVDAYAMLANSLLLAREYDASLAPLRIAAEMSPKGDLSTRLGQVLIDREEWDEAVSVLFEAVRKGDLYDAGSANLMLGISLYHQKKTANAREYFVTALEYDTSRESAGKWIVLLEREGRDG
jgi:tetratricopeptide (TPR) repeat protein